MQISDEGVERESDGAGFATDGEHGDWSAAGKTGTFAEGETAPLRVGRRGGRGEVDEPGSGEGVVPDSVAEFWGEAGEVCECCCRR